VRDHRFASGASPWPCTNLTAADVCGTRVAPLPQGLSCVGNPGCRSKPAKLTDRLPKDPADPAIRPPRTPPLTDSTTAEVVITLGADRLWSVARFRRGSRCGGCRRAPHLLPGGCDQEPRDQADLCPNRAPHLGNDPDSPGRQPKPVVPTQPTLTSRSHLRSRSAAPRTSRHDRRRLLAVVSSPEPASAARTAAITSGSDKISIHQLAEPVLRICRRGCLAWPYFWPCQAPVRRRVSGVRPRWIGPANRSESCGPGEWLARRRRKALWSWAPIDDNAARRRQDRLEPGCLEPDCPHAGRSYAGGGGDPAVDTAGGRWREGSYT
jgi:hypothetical protein